MLGKNLVYHASKYVRLWEFLYLLVLYFLTLLAFGKDKIPARRGIEFILFSQLSAPDPKIDNPPRFLGGCQGR